MYDFLRFKLAEHFGLNIFDVLITLDGGFSIKINAKDMLSVLECVFIMGSRIVSYSATKETLEIHRR